MVETMEGLPNVGEGSRSGPRRYMLSGKSHGVSARKVGWEVDVGVVVGDLFNARVESASRLLSEEFGVLATESVIDTYVPVLGHVEEAASVVERIQGWLRPVGEGVGEAPPSRDIVGSNPGAVGTILVGGGGEPWDTQMEEDEDVVLGGFRAMVMSENELNAIYHREDMSEDENEGEGEVLERGDSGCKGCGGAMAKLELRLRRLTSMVSLLMADRGLAGYGSPRETRKRRGGALRIAARD